MKQPLGDSTAAVDRRSQDTEKRKNILMATHPVILLLVAGFVVGIAFCARKVWTSCPQMEVRAMLLASIALGVGFGTAGDRLMVPQVLERSRGARDRLGEEQTAADRPGLGSIFEILKDKKDLVDCLIETVHTNVVVLDRDGRILLANDVFAGISGYDPSELQGRDWITTFVPEAEREQVRQIFQRAMGENNSLASQCSITTRDSVSRSIQWKWRPLKGLKEEPRGVFMLGMDVTEREGMENALRKSEARYRAIVEDQTELISRFKPDGTLTFVNGAYSRYFGEHPEQLLGSRFWHHVPKHEQERLKKHIAGMDRDNPLSTIEHPVKTPNGIRWQQWTDRAILDAEGQVVELQAVGRDITERKRVEQALVSERSRLYSVLDNLPLFVFLQSVDYAIRFANRSFLRTFGEGAGRPCYEILQGRSEPCDECPSHEVLLKQQSQTWEWELAKTGRTYQMHSHPFTDVDDTPLILQLGIDVTDQRQYEADLRRSEAELRELSGRLLTAQEEERKRIAAELHDEIGSSLTGIIVSLQAIVNRLDENTSLLEPLRHLISVTEHTIQEARRIMTDLRPSMLDDLGIVKTLGWFSREFQKLHPQIHIEPMIDIDEEKIPDPLKIIIFRLVQEALHNVAKHSHAEYVSLSLMESGGTITLIIEDNGDGFEAGELGTQTLRKGLGLTSMRERTELSGGHFSLNTATGEGTTIVAIWSDPGGEVGVPANCGRLTL
jgi:PAS domain S-box-containing protein